MPDILSHQSPTNTRLGDTLPAPIRDPAPILDAFSQQVPLSSTERNSVAAHASRLVETVRAAKDPGMMELFLAEYGLSSREGIALMCLAEALLRVPDAATIDRLIEDKVAPSDWGRHLGASASSLVNASTWGLLLTGRVLKRDEGGLAQTLQGLVRRLGEPVIRTAVGQAMKVLGQQFVLGETIEAAMRRASNAEAEGITYSYDMLGEAARTRADADRYAQAYRHAIDKIAQKARSGLALDNPGISIKLSALHPRYEDGQVEQVLAELVPVLSHLARRAATAGIGFTIDAEEQDRLALSLDVIETLFDDKALADWQGFGVVVQAYGTRAATVIDALYGLAAKHQRRMTVRLVKGAYWDQEVKRAQTLGLAGFPVFTTKAATDVSYLGCAASLMAKRDWLTPQFATHNAHTLAAILAMAGGDVEGFELQRLHGMGEVLHKAVRAEHGTRLRIYAPVGAHRDLLAYLVRRLLENGANSSFVHQVVDTSVPAATITRDPLERLAEIGSRHPHLKAGPDLFQPVRSNALGWDWTDRPAWRALANKRDAWRTHRWSAKPMLAAAVPTSQGRLTTITNPANPSDIVGQVETTDPEQLDAILATARAATPDWAGRSAKERGTLLQTASDLMEVNAPELFALLAREAGKTHPDAVAELREAVDFLHYYAKQAPTQSGQPQGVFTCISPWNFPLAIFLGQISAALATGNTVLAKPAEQTALVAARAVELMHQAGVPREVLQLLPGDGAQIGAALAVHPGIDGFCFTGSTATAKQIDYSIATKGNPAAPLIAETGGLNAMIVDSTALPEQAVRDIIASSFQSAGQRCSALRILYLQEEIAPTVLEMLKGAMDCLKLGDPWHLETDVGPVIDREAQAKITSHISAARAEGRLLHQTGTVSQGTFVPPTVLKIQGIDDLEQEIFGPVLHVATFKVSDLDRVIASINGKGYGLTFGLHSRIDDRVQEVSSAVAVGNAYVNRNQIGAIVASQPFGGEGLSGTGPKAGGPHYLSAFMRDAQAPQRPVRPDDSAHRIIERKDLEKALKDLNALPLDEGLTLDLPGPTGESNRLTSTPRGVVLCLGPSLAAAKAQAALARETGCPSLIVTPGASTEGPGSIALDGELTASLLTEEHGFELVLCWGDKERQREVRQALTRRPGPIIPMVAASGSRGRFYRERHLCIDTTAAGGNAQLLALSD